MKRVLVTGGTVFVSKYVAGYFKDRGYEVYVLNRNSRPQVQGVKLIESDRRDVGDKLSGLSFDAVLDITAYNAEDIRGLVSGLGEFGTYIMVSSSAVYPETEKQPFTEKTPLGENRFWGKYGTDKIEAEETLLKLVPDAYILRPPYLYGPMNNVYREAFVFDCAMQDRKFYLPGEGDMPLQFFYVDDLCRIIEPIIDKRPTDHIINVGNKESVSIREWVGLCYECAGKKPEFVQVDPGIEQRNYFSFYNYPYELDVEIQSGLLKDTTKLKEGLTKSYEWYKVHSEEVRKKPYIEYIDESIGGK